MDSFPSLLADTLVVVDAINAGATIKTGVLFTVIDILLAICPSETEITCTSETPVRFTNAHAMFPTHIGGDELYPARLRVIRLQGDGATVYHLT